MRVRSSNLEVHPLVEYYCCPEKYIRVAYPSDRPLGKGYFQCGDGVTCYGSYAGRKPPSDPPGVWLNALCDTELKDGVLHIPFDPSEVIDNLRLELYASGWRDKFPMAALAAIYYFFRPMLPVKIRKHLQEFHFRGWRDFTFPRWPVDCSVDNLLGQLLSLTLKAGGATRIPFIWFWPEGATSCAIMTHDIETELGRNFCKLLMDTDEAFGIKASFQVIPEQRYTATPEFLASIRDRGFEIVVHDLNHDGHLYRNRKQFLERAKKINSHAAEYGAEGFRAASLYRKQLWYSALNVSYDMSIPNVAHLDPQRGGCCTVMPYFIGDVLELPVTTTQDYTLFNILNDYSIELWKQQIEIIMAKHGLTSFIVHPDYVTRPESRRVYEGLLAYLSCIEEEKGVWIDTPGEVNRWWRQRAAMSLNYCSTGWRIEGLGSERARLAYAYLDDDGQLAYEIESVPAESRVNW
jgi:hypothetical protein